MAFPNGPMNDATADMDRSTLQVFDSESSDDDEIMKMKHRRSLIVMEQNLMEPCDQSPIIPERLRQEQSFTEGGSLERLLLERLLLRKELRLRSMQERLLDQESKLEEMERRVKEVESMIGYRMFCSVSSSIQNAVTASERGVSWARIGFNCILATLYQAFFIYFLNLIPSSLSLGGAAMVQRVGSVMAQRAENFSNECVENMEWSEEKEKRSQDGAERRRRRRR